MLSDKTLGLFPSVFGTLENFTHIEVLPSSSHRYTRLVCGDCLYP